MIETQTPTPTTIAACCAEPANRRPVDLPPEQVAAAQARGATPFHQTCAVCGRNHYGLIADPVTFGLTGQSLR